MTPWHKQLTRKVIYVMMKLVGDLEKHPMNLQPRRLGVKMACPAYDGESDVMRRCKQCTQLLRLAESKSK
ncbi:hypothetical protein J32TS2_22540 [Shouchella clausii]|nr:hypothetical protein J32TS2_22540 [Shouchella clausii]